MLPHNASGHPTLLAQERQATETDATENAGSSIVAQPSAVTATEKVLGTKLEFVEKPVAAKRSTVAIGATAAP